MQSFDRINSLHLMVGSFQAVLAYGLYEAADHGVWPATHAAAFIPLFMLMLFFPFAFYCANNALTVRRWLISFAIALLAAGVGLYQGLTVSGWASGGTVMEPNWSPASLGDYMVPALILSLALFLLVPALALYQGSWRVDYRRWMLSLHQNAQLLLQASLVLGLFWALLLTAAALFGLIDLHFMQNLIERSWFSIPLSVLVFSHGVSLAVRNHNVVDYLSERAGQLCSWLYPMAAILGLGFVLSWLVQGLDTLLATGHAANLLLWFATLSLLLLNMANQGGVQSSQSAGWLRWLALLGTLALLPMTLVAAYALGLRIDQYGLTPTRIWAAFVNLVLMLMVLGYLLHSVQQVRDASRSWIASTNAFTAVVVVLGILLMLAGPLDPRRISVASQIARLQHDSTVDAVALIGFLARDGGRFGTEALWQLAKQEGVAGSLVAERAAMAQRALERPDNQVGDADAVIASLPIFPAGVSLPRGLQEQLATYPELADCSVDLAATNACLIWQLKLRPEGPDEYVLLSRRLPVAHPFGVLWQQTGDGDWDSLGRIDLNTIGCPPRSGAQILFEALIKGQVEMQVKQQRDLMVNGVRIPTTTWQQDSCN
ncbi:MAG: DUF4153 domain-containing protein [Halopseudomonas sabulinigri]